MLAVLQPIWNDIPESASRLRGRIEKILAAARTLGLIDENRANPARWKDHLEHLLSKPAKLTRGHHKALAHSDLPGFWTKLTEIDTTASRALAFTILTACRTSEALHMTWREISFADAMWRVPEERMKMKKQHDVPLSDTALSILADARAAARKPPTAASFVFPGRPRQPLSTMAMSMLLRRLGVDATVHGMRSAFRDWASEAGVDFETGEMCAWPTRSGTK